jgi:hypothetical protein
VKSDAEVPESVPETKKKTLSGVSDMADEVSLGWTHPGKRAPYDTQCDDRRRGMRTQPMAKASLRSITMISIHRSLFLSKRRSRKP